MGFFSAVGKLVVAFLFAPIIGGVIGALTGLDMLPAIGIGWIVAVAFIWWVS